ncbi:hypothetical protein BTJ40_04900 [Microbulbifer sp. A4B17]|uniref:hypothetical protein n=1 Tax=Microbulbifer sp. A4B17 TaxID=359370 RepID=UPI000D52C62F|nr:hypothetical protein [Microbulbifer sp. A4B17]AWF80199.1 hypothetical protein BTJ40_04900 [Microbulbifer sp. A4B17]
MTEENYPLIDPDGEKVVREKVCLKKKEEIEKALLEDDRCPARVIAFNFSSRESGGKIASPKPCCDIAILEYLEREGKFPVGYIIKKHYVHSVIQKGGLVGNPLVTYALRRKIKGVYKPRTTNKIDKKYIQKICQNEKLQYRPYAIKEGKTSKTIIFWHPEHGYSQANLKHWIKSPTTVDPFRNLKKDKEIIRRAKLVVFDNQLHDNYEVVDGGVFRESGVTRVTVFCKQHGIKTSATINNIEVGLWFNCPECSSDDFENIRRLHNLRRDEVDDRGSTIIALMLLSVNGNETLKFGISSSRSNSDEDDDILKKRYGNNLVKIFDSIRCDSELEARELEQELLVETRDIRNYSVPDEFAGKTECRSYTTKNLNRCMRLFSDLKAEYGAAKSGSR